MKWDVHDHWKRSMSLYKLLNFFQANQKLLSYKRICLQLCHLLVYFKRISIVFISRLIQIFCFHLKSFKRICIHPLCLFIYRLFVSFVRLRKDGHFLIIDFRSKKRIRSNVELMECASTPVGILLT